MRAWNSRQKQSSFTVFGDTALAEEGPGASSRLSLGKVLFVEIGMEQSNLAESNAHTEDAAQHVLANGSTLGLRYAPTEAFRKQNIVASYHRQYAPGDTTFGGFSTMALPVETGYDWRRQRSQLVASEYRHPELEVNRDGDTGVTLTVNGRVSVSVESGEEKQLALSEIEFERKGTGETETTKPIISIRNSGFVDVYGSSEARVFPVDSGKQWANRWIQTYENNPDVKTERTGKVLAAYPPDGK